MFKKSPYRCLFDKQHGKWDQTVLKYECHNFYHIFLWRWRQLSSKEYLLVTCKIFGLLFSTLTRCHNYSLLDRDNSTRAIQMQSSLKRKTFSDFFSMFLKCRSNFELFQSKMTLIANVFWKLQTRKTVIR